MKTRTRARWCLASVALAITCTAIFVGGQRLFAYAHQRLRAAVTQQLSRAWHREVRIGHIERRANGSFVIADISVGGLDHEPALLTAPEATARVDVGQLLFRRKVVVRSLFLRQPRFFLRSAATTVASVDHMAALDQLAANGLKSLSVNDGDFTYEYMPAHAPRRTVHLTEVMADATLTPASTHVHLTATQAQSHGQTLTRLSLLGARSGHVVTIKDARAEYEGNALTAAGTYALDSGKTSMRLSGPVSLERMLALKMKDLPWSARGMAQTQLSLSADARGWQEASGEVKIDDAQLIPQHGKPFNVTASRAAFRASPKEMEVTDISLRAEGMELNGALIVKSSPLDLRNGAPYEFNGTVNGTEWRRFAPELSAAVKGGKLSIKVAFKDTLPHLPNALRGQIALADAQIVPPKSTAEPVNLDFANGDFAWEKDGLRLSRLTARADGLDLNGAMIVHAPPFAIGKGTPYEFSGNVTASAWNSVRRIVPDLPANLQKGRLTLKVAVSDRFPRFSEALRGQFTLTDASILPSKNAAAPIIVQSSTGNFVADSHSLKVNDLFVKMDGMKLNGSIRLDASPFAIGDGTPYEFHGKVTTSDWKQVRSFFSYGSYGPDLANKLQSGSLALEVAIRSRLPRLAESLSGGFVLKDAKVAPDGKSPQFVKSARGTFTAGGDALKLRDLYVKIDGFEVTGALTLNAPAFAVGNGTPYEFNGTVAAWDWKRVREWFPGLPPNIHSGRLSATLRLKDRIPNVPRSLSGEFALTDARIQPSAKAADVLNVRAARGVFSRRGDRLDLSEVRAELGDVHAKGSMSVQGIGGKGPAHFQLATALTGSNLVSVAQQFAPAFAHRVRSGSFAIRANSSGDTTSGVTSLNGTMNIHNARLTAPALNVRSLSSPFVRRGDNLELTDVRLVAREFTGRGAATIQTNGKFTMNAALEVARLRALSTIHPAFDNVTGSSHVQVSGEGRTDELEHAIWTGKFEGQDGTWKLPRPMFGMSSLTFDQMRGGFRIKEGRTDFGDLILDGRQMTVHGDGHLAPSGDLSGGGTAKVAREIFTRFIGPTLSDLLAREINRLHIDALTAHFKLSGTANSPQIRWEMDSKVIQQLVEKSLLGVVERKATKTLENKLAKIVGLKTPLPFELPGTEPRIPTSPGITAEAPEIGPAPPATTRKDREKKVIKRVLGGLLNGALNGGIPLLR